LLFSYGSIEIVKQGRAKKKKYALSQQNIGVEVAM
jgi:hypothetical protein